MEQLAIRLGKARVGDLGFTLTINPTGKRRCYIRDPGPPERLQETACDTIVIVDSDK